MTAIALERGKTEATPPEPTYRLKSGAKPHVFTKEDRRKGALRTNAKRAEIREQARKTMLERLADELRERQDSVVATYFGAMEQGDWRAAADVLDRVHGKPVQRTENVNADVAAIAGLTEEQLDRLAGIVARSLTT